MANPIRRLLQIVLDKASASKAERDAKRALSGIESGIESIGATARRIAGILATVFGIRALINFGKESVKQALEGERAWSELAGTISAAGKDFKGMEGDLRALGRAFQDATTHGADDYATTLSRMITLTGDVSASTNNMGLVANVAAQFFAGDLGPAVELVSRVMTGNLTVLAKMGIHVRTAQQGLEVLASRSFGAAERAAERNGGKIERLGVLWKDFKQTLGEVLLSSGNTVGVIDVLSGAVKSMIQWVKDNKDELRTWVSEGIKFAIDSLKSLGQAIQEFLRIRGALSFTGTAGKTPLGETREELQAQIQGFRDQLKQALAEQQAAQSAFDAASKFRLKDFFSLPGAINRMKRINEAQGELQSLTDQINQINKNIDEAEAKLKTIGKGPPKPKPTLFGNKPVVASTIETPESKAIADALDKFKKDMRAADEMSKLLGPDWDVLGAKAVALTAVMQTLAANGVKPTAKNMQEWAAQLQGIEQAQTLDDLKKSLSQLHLKAEQLGPDFDMLGGEAELLQGALEKMTEKFGRADPRVQAIVARLKELGIAIPIDQFEKGEKAAALMWEAIAQPPATLSDVFEQRITALRDQATRLLDAMEAIPKQMRASSPQFADYARQYKAVQSAIQATTEAQKMAVEVSNDVAGALMAAFKGQLGAYAAGKAEQNMLEAAELGVQAAASAIFSLGIATGPLLALAAEHVAIAGAWAALSAGFGGAGKKSGGGLAGARGVSGGFSRDAAPSQDVTIVLSGPGFHALNPEVQKVVVGAQEQARTRFGKNTKVRVTRRP